ncbi:MAG: DUF2235 domain-containing protein [Xanthomonadales bacterium]|nr:DUF2235 domain-containing protein [Xanthomonadales bacterium]
MNEQHKVEPDGILGDGVSFEPVAPHSPAYPNLRRQLAPFRVPIVLHANDPHERLYVASFDGTGNDARLDPKHATNVGLVARQIQKDDNPRIGGGYVEGPGTQQYDPVGRLIDGMLGLTINERAEQMYRLFTTQAWRWKQQDPDARITVLSVSFSRGSEVSALFARLVDERGIQNPTGAIHAYGPNGQLKHAKYSSPPLAPPHQVAQGVAMFDPVGTGHAMHTDRRLPPSVISGIELIALDEPRFFFKSDHIIDPGITPDGRFAGVYVPGAHSDVGGGGHRNGLAVRAGNVVIDYINGFSDEPFLVKSTEPDDPRLNVIHHPQDDKLVYRLSPKVDRQEPAGYNELQVPRSLIRRVPDPNNAEPRDEALSARFERQPMPNGPLPAAPGHDRESAHSDLDRWIACMYQAARQPDPGIWNQVQRTVVQEYMDSPDGRLFQQQVAALERTWGLPLQAQAYPPPTVLDQATSHPQEICR